MELSRSVDHHIIMIARKYFDHLRVTDGEIKIRNCSSVFVEIFGTVATWGIDFFFLVRSKIFYLIISLQCVQVQR